MLESKYIALSNLEFANTPFPHFSTTSVFKAGLESNIYNWLEQIDFWEYTKTNFYTQYEFSLLAAKLPDTLELLIHEDTISYIVDRFKQSFNVPALKLVDVTVHKLLDGHRMGVHNDFLGNIETHRLIIQLNPAWEQKNGGFLMLFNSKYPEDVAKIVRPLNNTAIGFEISQKSYHAVSTVYDFCRYTLVYTFTKIEMCC